MIRRLVIFFVVCSMLSCKKKEVVIANEELITTEMHDGLPPDYKSINGYFFAGYTNYSGDPKEFLFSYATFAEPAKNLLAGYGHQYGTLDWNSKLLGNVDVGKVSCNSRTLNPGVGQSTAIYQISNQGFYEIPDPTEWKMEGNRTFKSQNVTCRKLPAFIFRDMGFDTIIKSRDYTLQIDSILTGYDSVVVILADGMNSSVNITKRLHKDTKTVLLQPKDFENFYVHNTWGLFTFYAFNYSHKTVEGKTYVFEQSLKKSGWVSMRNF